MCSVLFQVWAVNYWHGADDVYVVIDLLVKFKRPLDAMVVAGFRCVGCCDYTDGARARDAAKKYISASSLIWVGFSGLAPFPTCRFRIRTLNKYSHPIRTDSWILVFLRQELVVRIWDNWARLG